MKIIWEPNPGPQTAFLLSEAKEVLYGGAAGGGKTDALLMLPVYRAHNPDHRSIYFRRKSNRLSESEDRAKSFFGQIDPEGYWHQTSHTS